ncbi:YggT family protein [Carnimonas nigrificans]|uniref:YggT family protein n=1 Tax=Carnimonas nigrificans TaxID=64323 RepID=UPI00046F2A3E|nr:YggT family protein [Carnimonas nigrificans]
MGQSLLSGPGLINFIFSFFIFVLMARFAMHASRVDGYNPIAHGVIRATNWLIKPIQKVIRPIAGRFDLATVIAALVVKVIALVLTGNQVYGVGPLLIAAVAGVILMLLQVYWYALILMVVMSWIAPQDNHPAPMLIRQLTEPVMAPLRKVIPPLGMLDLSPIIAFLLINFLEYGVSALANRLVMAVILS